MCDERERLIGYVYDECEADERQRISDHLQTCITCRHEINGLRSVRQDLLAWAVPDHDPVWRPMTPPVAWWRQVPAWAAAAAAGVMLMVGAAGGVLTHALVPEQRAAVGTAEAPAVQPPAVLTSTDLSAAEQRILQFLRTELESRARVTGSMQPVRLTNAGMTDDQILQRVNEMNSANQAQFIELVTKLYNDFRFAKTQTDKRLEQIETHPAIVGGGGR